MKCILWILCIYFIFIFLDQKLDYMFDTVFQLYYIFYGSVSTNLGTIMLPVFKLVSYY